MLDEAGAAASGEPYLLAVDNRTGVPANTPLRLQTTATDVIHSLAVPSLWFKFDAVPGRLNEKPLIIKEPGVRSEEHTPELQLLMRNSYAGFCLKNKTTYKKHITEYH